MPTFLKITFTTDQKFIWNGTLNDEEVKEKDKKKILSKISNGILKPFSKDLLIDDVMLGGLTIITPKYSIKIFHSNIEHADLFSAKLEENELTVSGAILAKLSLKEDAIQDLKANLNIASISEFSIWNPESQSKKNFYRFTKTGVWKNDNKIEQEMFSGKEHPDRKLNIEISFSKIKMK